ncbi:stromal cell-derived factor 2-like protein [Leptotrombidium deliense]|uniref:Stromal cell-derived factor 2-like protein n=1 Tax=Leptotrombidium deliense TaxID=299467 RepID=A0A443SRR8_9ACAR|nr:stromal cell-derived factor 2-like protein [Leptotrombidium deliense]
MEFSTFFYVFIFLISNSILNCLCTSKVLYPYVTCGSVIKLVNNNYNARLHSHDVKYGSGSGQQSVTATEDKEDSNSYWSVLGKNGDHCTRGQPIKCGSVVRLRHLASNKNLHSHLFSSPLSGNQEVSAFGKAGEGDTGDDWTVTCSEEHWERDVNVRFKHVDTEMWLSTSGRSYGRPISGQLEVVGVSRPDSSSYWQTAEGIYIKPMDKDIIHDEL